MRDLVTIYYRFNIPRFGRRSHIGLVHSYNERNGYPENSFACVYHTSDPTAPLVIEFADSLGNLAGVQEVQLGQQLASPYLVSDRGPATPFVLKIFEYESEENFAAAGELLQRLVNRQNEGQGMMSIHLVNWRAEEYMSWLMD